MAQTESPNTLLSNGVLRVADLLCMGPISGFVQRNGPYGNDPLTAVQYDDVPIRNIDGSYNFNITGAGYSFAYMLGTVNQTGITGFQKVENIIPLSSNTRIANPPQGAGPFKPVVASFTSNVYPDADAVKVTVRVPALFAQDDNGNTNPYEIVYAVDISINNGRFVEQEQVTIRGKCTSPYQKTTVYQLPKSVPATSFNEWKVRVRRVSQNILSIRTQNEIFVDSISVISSSLYAYPNTVVVGTQIGADQFSSIPSRSYEIAGMLVSVPNGYNPTSYGYSQAPFTRLCGVDAGIKHIVFNTQNAGQAQGITPGMAVTGVGIPANSVVTAVNAGPPYFFTIDQDPTATTASTPVSFTPLETVPTVTPATYPNVWTGDFRTGVWTDNPAWIFYDLVTNPVHGLGRVVPADTVDKWSLYRIAQYCDEMVDDGDGGLEPRFTCNVNIQQPQDAWTVLLNMASVFRGMLYYANGAIHTVQNQDDPPVTEFTNANVVNGVFSYSDTARNTRSTVAVVKWVDPENNYRENVEYVEDTDGILRYGYQEKQMTAFATTSRGQAARLGAWTLQTERLLTETVTFQASQDAVALAPGDNFAIYDNFRNNLSQGGRITAFDSTRSLITLDRNVTLDTGSVYTLNAMIPKFQLDGTGDLTGSNQIDYQRQSQIESFRVVTPLTSTTNQLLISGAFSTGLAQGSIFILSQSGNSNVLQSASFYTCLATAEVSPGIIEVLGLQANTGINFASQTGYTTAVYPVNSGDLYSTILPPSNLRVTGVTGLSADNQFFSAIRLTWLNTPSEVSYYIVSGKEWDTSYEQFTVINTGFNWTRGDTGQYLFKVAAVSPGGRISDFITGGFLVSSMNPLGTLRQLSGVRLTQNYDPLYTSATSGYTGYVGINPGFEWTIPVDNRGNEIVDAQFISGWRWDAKSFDGNVTYASGQISGVDQSRFQFTGDLLLQFPGTPRGFDFVVRSIDVYGNLAAGGNLRVNNPPMKAPFSSGFVGFNGGVIYNVTPSLQYDTSGIYLWANQSPSFTPTFSNYQYTSDNLAGNAQIAPQTGSFYTWFALGDTFNATGNTIYGPISGNANGVVSSFVNNVALLISGADAAVSGAFAQLTGTFTNTTNLLSGQNQLTLSQVNGLSGQIIGTTLGAANTALTVRVDSAVVSSSGVLATQINAVQANLNTVNSNLTSQISTVSTALTNSGVALGSRVDTVSANLTSTGVSLGARVDTVALAVVTSGGALSQWLTQLGAQTSGQNASVTIGARAFVTGDVNGIGGVAVANWGFKLDANNKVVSMMASSESWGAGSTEFGTITFGGANLQSENYVAGVDGWIIKGNGNVEFGTGEFRGNLAAAQSGILIGRYEGYSTKPFLVFPDDSNTLSSKYCIGATVSTTDAVASNTNWRAPFFKLQNVWRNGSLNLVEGQYLQVTPTVLQFGSGTTDDIYLRHRSAVHLATNAVIQSTGLHVVSGNSAGAIPSQYLAGVMHRENATSKYGFFVGTNWAVSENKIFTAASVDAGAGTVNEAFVVYGNKDAALNGNMTAISFNTTSSLRFKDNVQSISGALSIVEALRGVTFDWKRDGKHDFGVIAEEVAQVLPSAVVYDHSGNVNAVDYGRLNAYLIEAVKDLSRQVKELKRVQ